MTIAKTACRNAALKASEVDESLLVAQSTASTLETPESATFIDGEEALQEGRGMLSRHVSACREESVSWVCGRLVVSRF